MAENGNKFSLDKSISLNTLIAIISCFAGGFFFLERLEEKIVDRIMLVMTQKEQITAETHKGLDQRITNNKENIDHLRTVTEKHTEQIAVLNGRAAKIGRMGPEEEVIGDKRAWK